MIQHHRPSFRPPNVGSESTIVATRILTQSIALRALNRASFKLEFVLFPVFSRRMAVSNRRSFVPTLSRLPNRYLHRSNMTEFLISTSSRLLIQA